MREVASYPTLSLKVSDMYFQNLHERRTAEKVVAVTPLPQDKAPPETPQFPLEVVILKLLPVPVNVYVASVCVDQVPALKRPPVELAWMVPLAGSVPGV